MRCDFYKNSKHKTANVESMNSHCVAPLELNNANRTSNKNMYESVQWLLAVVLLYTVCISRKLIYVGAHTRIPCTPHIYYYRSINIQSTGPASSLRCGNVWKMLAICAHWTRRRSDRREKRRQNSLNSLACCRYTWDTTLYTPLYQTSTHTIIKTTEK